MSTLAAVIMDYGKYAHYFGSSSSSAYYRYGPVKLCHLAFRVACSSETWWWDDLWLSQCDLTATAITTCSATKFPGFRAALQAR